MQNRRVDLIEILEIAYPKFHLGNFLCKIAGCALLKSKELHIQSFISEISSAKAVLS